MTSFRQTAFRQASLVLCADADDVALHAAQRLMARALDAKDRAAICLSGGSTPLRLYRLLATEPYRSALPWDRIHWFWGDERYVHAEDARSNWGAARAALFEPLAISPTLLHPIAMADRSLDLSATATDQNLKRFYGAETLDPARPFFDLVLLGVGQDGHTASLFPGKPALDERRRWAAVSEAGQEPLVPRITLTMPVLASSRETLMLVSGQDKRPILERIFKNKDPGEDLPAAQLGAGPQVTWLIDRAAMPDEAA